MNPKKILFLPYEVGIAHVTRSYTIAEELASRGQQVFFAVPDRKKDLFSNPKITHMPLVPYAQKDSMDFWDNFTDPNYVKEFCAHDQVLIDQVKPDILVNDFRITAIPLTIANNIPSVFVAGGGGLPQGCKLPNIFLLPFIKKIAEPIEPFFVQIAKRGFFNSLLKVSQDLCGRAVTMEEMFSAFTYVVPEPVGYLSSLRPDLDKPHYVGLLSWNGFKNQGAPEWLDSIQKDGKTVYLTFGGTGFDKQKFINLASELLQFGLRVVVSTSSIAEVSEFPKDNNLFVAKFLPGPEICRRVDVVVCHGGFGTMTEAVQAATPIVAVPFNPDQYLHAFRFAELGLGKCSLKVTPFKLLQILKEGFIGFEDVGKSVPVGKIVADTLEVLQNKHTYQHNLDHWKSIFKSEDSASKAAKIIEKL